MKEKRRRLLRAVSVLLLIGILGVSTGCSGEKKTQKQEKKTETADAFEKIKTDCSKAFLASADKNDPNPAVSKQAIIEALGEKGYAAVDRENRVCPACPEKLKDFIEQVQQGEDAQVYLIELTYPEGANLLELRSEKGEVSITEKICLFDGKELTESESAEYKASVFSYTEDGYLMIEGAWVSPESYVLTLSEEEMHLAVRLEPLDETYRRLTEAYVEPVGYGANNLFLVDWSQEDPGALDLCDAYDVFYRMEYGTASPYTASEDCSAETVYQIPQADFEQLLQKHLALDSAVIREKADYSADTQTYTFRPRSFYERDYCEIPYPEVAGCTENEDGTLTLTVHAVYPNENTSDLFTHTVVVQPTEEGFRYLSNRIDLGSGGKADLWWHKDREEGK